MSTRQKELLRRRIERNAKTVHQGLTIVQHQIGIVGVILSLRPMIYTHVDRFTNDLIDHDEFLDPEELLVERQDFSVSTQQLKSLAELWNLQNSAWDKKGIIIVYGRQTLCKICRRQDLDQPVIPILDPRPKKADAPIQILWR